MPGNCYSVEHTVSSGHTSSCSCRGGDRSRAQRQCPTSSTCLSSFLLRVLLQSPRSLLSPHAGAAHKSGGVNTSGPTPYRWRMRQVGEGSGLPLCTASQGACLSQRVPRSGLLFGLSSFSHFLLPGITFQILPLPSSPRLRLCFCRNRN